MKLMEISLVLKRLNFLINEHLVNSIQLIALLNKIVAGYNKNNIKEPFNIILATSDIYYRENYHSDIIAYILRYKNSYLNNFFKFINLNKQENQEGIDVKNYKKYEIIREEGKIDILIKNDETKHCVIVENKIYNAGDMPRQLPRYYLRQIDNGFIVDKILYFSLDGTKRPNKSTWTESDFKSGLDNLIIYAAASNDTENDFISSFINKCYNTNETKEENSFFEQYKSLLIYLRRHEMDYQLMEKFYQEMKNPDNYNTALSIRTMLNDFETFRRDKIHNNFSNNHRPFSSISRGFHNDTFFHTVPELSKENMKIDVFSNENKTEVQFWIQEPKTKTDEIFEILKLIKEEQNFIKKDINCYCIEFGFPEEDEKMYKYLSKLFKLLDDNKEAISEICFKAHPGT
jgi:hypothetical protein